MIVKTLFIAAVTSLVLTACGSTESYTTDFLYENTDIRTQVLADCKENKQTDSNCSNANDAENKIKGEAWADAKFK